MCTAAHIWHYFFFFKFMRKHDSIPTMLSINFVFFFHFLLIFWWSVVRCSDLYIEVIASAPAIQGANVTFEAYLKDVNGHTPPSEKLEWVCNCYFLVSHAQIFLLTSLKFSLLQEWKIDDTLEMVSVLYRLLHYRMQ